MELNEAKLHDLLGKVVNEMGAAANGSLVLGACAHAKSALKPDGTCMIVEPFALDTLEENLNPVGRSFYAFSTMLCTPCSLNQEVGLTLGAQAGEKRLKETINTGGFSQFKRATETPLNLILEARP